MAGEIQLNSTTMATESSGSITAELDTIRPNTTNGSLTLQGDSSNSGVTGLTIDSSGNATFAQTISGGTLGSGVVFPAGSIVGWEQVTTVPTAIQGSDTSYTDVTGSSKNYTPSSGSNYVVYEYSTTIQGNGTNGVVIPLFKFFYDGSEVANTNHALYLAGSSALQGIGYYTMRFILSSWSGSKNLKLQYRAYSTLERFQMHKSQFSGNGTTTDVFTNIYQVTYSVM